MSLKIVSVNIEGDKHLERVKAFLAKEKAEVICLVEVFEERVEELAGSEYPHRVFAPNVSVDGKKMGAAILSKNEITTHESYYCEEYSESTLPLNEPGRGVHAPVVLFAEIMGNGEIYRIGTTHFSWTPDGGRVNERQKRHGAKLIEFLSQQGEFVLTGDFNMARGRNEVYEELAKLYKDNIPQEVTTTLDPNLHRINKTERGKLALVVDYLWTTAGYKAENVRVVGGVSDHCAVVSEISKV